MVFIVATDVALLLHTTPIFPIPFTVTGTVELVIVPLPSWPLPFNPQHCTVPPEGNAQLW